MSRAIVSRRRIGALIAVAACFLVAGPAAALAADPDTDGDGYSDSVDQCPNTPGGPQGPNNPPGCPAPTSNDTDGDGVSNQNDACPDVRGNQFAQQPGCPDRDGDEIIDSKDVCPDEKGAISEGDNGCPDKDQDGVKDARDACPTQQGTAAEGCPPPNARFNFPTNNTWEMAQSKRQLAVCKDTPRLAHCTMRMIVTLAGASAKRLHIRNPELVDRVVTTTTRSTVHEMVTGPWQWSPSNALKAALKKYGRSVTVILSGSYRIAGSTEWTKLDTEKVVVKPKSCGWNRFSCA